jgi:hypothetical protein
MLRLSSVTPASPLSWAHGAIACVQPHRCVLVYFLEWRRLICCFVVRDLLLIARVIGVSLSRSAACSPNAPLVRAPGMFAHGYITRTSRTRHTPADFLSPAHDSHLSPAFLPAPQWARCMSRRRGQDHPCTSLRHPAPTTSSSRLSPPSQDAYPPTRTRARAGTRGRTRTSMTRRQTACGLRTANMPICARRRRICGGARRLRRARRPRRPRRDPSPRAPAPGSAPDGARVRPCTRARLFFARAYAYGEAQRRAATVGAAEPTRRLRARVAVGAHPVSARTQPWCALPRRSAMSSTPQEPFSQ